MSANMLSKAKSLAVAKESLSPTVVTRRHRKFSATLNIYYRRKYWQKKYV